MQETNIDVMQTDDFIDDVIIGYYDSPVIDNTVVAYGDGIVIIEDETGTQYILESNDPVNEYPIGTMVDADTLSIATPVGRGGLHENG